MSTAIVLAGHGSHISPRTAGLVWEHVDGLRALGLVDEVTAAFWKEAPSFHQVLRSLTATDVTIVPLFTAQGYFTQTVIPAEMGLAGPLTIRDGRTIRYTRTLSEHPYLSQIVRLRVRGALQASGAPPGKTAVAIIGHSTRRNPESRRATEAQARLIRALEPVAEVVDVYLDDSPAIGEVYALTSAPTLIAVPYFLALGSHTTQDVPGELGLEPGQTSGQVRGRKVYYTPPVGVEQSLREVIIELARDAGTPLYEARNEAQNQAQDGSAWDHCPAAGRNDLIAAVHEAGQMSFGQLLLTPHEVRRNGREQPLETLTNPAALRARVREQPFRPLATSADLPGGWRVPVSHPAMLHAVVETVYPGAVADWAAHRRGTLLLETLASTTARQTGMYRALSGYAHSADTVARICGACVRHPTWYFGHSPADAIPCAEGCNLWMTKALEAVVQRE
jgi:sirohydrochlorin cobaltochelatase